MEMAFGIIGMALGVVILMCLCIKGVDIYISTILAMLVVALFCGFNLFDTAKNVYMTGFTNFFKNNFLLYACGVLFGKFIEISGAAEAIGELLVRTFGKKYSILALVATLVICAYCCSTTLCLFAIWPIMVSVFKDQDIPRYLLPALFWFGCSTGANCAPGTIQNLNLVTTQALGVGPMAAPAVGFIGAGTMLVCDWIFFRHFLKKARNKGDHFNPEGMFNSDEERIDRKLPNGIVSFIPLFFAIFVLNLKADGKNVFPNEIALLIASVFTCILLFKYIDWKNITSIIETGVKQTINFVGPICALVGFGSVISADPAFEVIVDTMFKLPFSPLISLAVATNVVCAISASATGAASIAATTLGQPYIAMGMNPELVARTIVTSAVAFDTMPHNALIPPICYNMCHETLKTTYWPMFCIAVISPLIGVGTLILTSGIFY